MIQKEFNSQLDKTFHKIGFRDDHGLIDKPIPYNLFSKDFKSNNSSISSIYLSDGRMGFHAYNDFLFVMCYSFVLRKGNFIFGDEKRTTGGNASVWNTITVYSKNTSTNVWKPEAGFSTDIAIFSFADFKEGDLVRYRNERRRIATDCVWVMGKIISDFPKDKKKIVSLLNKCENYTSDWGGSK